MGTFVSILVNGISYGLVLFLIATGMTMTMGLLRVVNMSHGGLFMIAGYFGVWVYNVTSASLGVWAWVLSILAAGALAGLIGLGMEVGLLRRLYSSPMNQVLLTIGFIYIFQNLTLWIFGGEPAAAPIPSFLTQTVQVGTLTIPYYRFFIIIFGVIIGAALWIMQDKTKIGARVRAGMDNGEIAGTLGLNRKGLFTFIFVLGSFIAGISAIVGGSLITLDQNTGWNVLLYSIIVVVVGGAGSIQGALLGGLILGVVNAFGQAYFPDFSSYLFYIVLIIILVIRPQGLLGRKLDIDKASDDYTSNKVIERRKFAPSMLGNNVTGSLKAKLNTYKIAPYVLVMIVAVTLPWFVSSSVQSVLTQVLIYILFACSLDIVMGYTGNRSFGHAAYFGMGGYMAGLLCVKLNIKSFWVALIVVIVVCAVLAAIIGYFTLKLSGTNFLLVTMAFGQLLSAIATKWSSLTGGNDGLVGITRPSFWFGEAADEWASEFWKGDTVNLKVYFFTLIIVAICYFIMHRFMHSSFGTTLRGVKGNEGRMRALGFNTWMLRYAGVIVAGIFAGIAGMLFAYWGKVMVPSNFALETSAMPMLMVIMGGGATLWGPAIGATIITLAKFFLNIITPDRWLLILGLLFVVCVLFVRNGFAPWLQNFYDRIGYRIFKNNIAAAGSISANAKAGKEAKS